MMTTTTTKLYTGHRVQPLYGNIYHTQPRYGDLYHTQSRYGDVYKIYVHHSQPSM